MAQGGAGRMRGPMTHKQRNTLWTYIFLAPTILGIALFIYLPFVISLGVSFTDWTLLRNPAFVGFANYIRIFTKDKYALNSFVTTLIFVSSTITIKMVLGMVLALLLNMGGKATGIFRFTYYLPSMVMGVPMAILWFWIFQKDGLLNAVLGVLGIVGPSWLYDTRFALASVIILDAWTVGNLVIIFLAGLKNVPQSYHESASIDGAGPVKRFFRITLPLISPIILYNFFLSTITALQSFDSAYVLTQGGPNRATYLWSIMIYESAFKNRLMGYASALAWLQFLVIFLFTAIVFRSSDRFVFYMASEK